MSLHLLRQAYRDLPALHFAELGLSPQEMVHSSGKQQQE
jgi:hypothetical protein